MDKMKLLKWLTAQSNIYKHEKKYQYFDNNVYRLDVQIDEIHINGALSICETLNIPFSMTEWSCNNSKADKVTFEWNGVKFFSLENFRTESEEK